MFKTRRSASSNKPEEFRYAVVVQALEVERLFERQLPRVLPG
jgi:hypothetical protein